MLAEIEACKKKLGLETKAKTSKLAQNPDFDSIKKNIERLEGTTNKRNHNEHLFQRDEFANKISGKSTYKSFHETKVSESLDINKEKGPLFSLASTNNYVFEGRRDPVLYESSKKKYKSNEPISETFMIKLDTECEPSDDSDEDINSSFPSIKQFQNKKNLREILKISPNFLKGFEAFLEKVRKKSEITMKHPREKNVSFGEFIPTSNLKVAKFNKRNKKMVADRLKQIEEVKKMKNGMINSEVSSFTQDGFASGHYTSPNNKFGLKVPANIELPQLGEITLAASIYKQIKDTNKYHARWMVLRGFLLYWYRSSYEKSAKGLISLPFKPIIERHGGKFDVFEIPEEKDRKLVFVLDGPGIIWRKTLANTIAYKCYLDGVEKGNFNFNHSICQYFREEHCEKMEINDLVKGNSSSLEQFLNLLWDSVSFHSKLRIVSIKNVNMNESSLLKLSEAFANLKVKPPLSSLEFESNNFGANSLNSLSGIISLNTLESLSIKKNMINDQDFSNFCEDMKGKHDMMKRYNADYLGFPFINLEFEETRLSDTALFSFSFIMDEILKDSYSQDFIGFLNLNFSTNYFTDLSLKSLSSSLKSFNYIKSLNISRNRKLSEDSLMYIAASLMENKSLRYLDFSDNYLSANSLNSITQTLEYNHVIQKIKITPFVGFEESFRKFDLNFYNHLEITEMK